MPLKEVGRNQTGCLYPSNPESKRLPVSKIEGTVRGGTELGVQTKQTASFLKQLMHIINDDNRFRGVTGWSADGKSFAILKRDIFVSEVLPAYFGPIKFESFMKRLFRHGFETKLICTLRRQDTAIYHPYFQRDEPELCKLIVPVGSGARTSKQKRKSTILLCHASPDGASTRNFDMVSSKQESSSCSIADRQSSYRTSVAAGLERDEESSMPLSSILRLGTSGVENVKKRRKVSTLELKGSSMSLPEAHGGDIAATKAFEVRNFTLEKDVQAISRQSASVKAEIKLPHLRLACYNRTNELIVDQLVNPPKQVVTKIDGSSFQLGEDEAPKVSSEMEANRGRRCRDLLCGLSCQQLQEESLRRYAADLLQRESAAHLALGCSNHIGAAELSADPRAVTGDTTRTMMILVDLLRKQNAHQLELATTATSSLRMSSPGSFQSQLAHRAAGGSCIKLVLEEALGSSRDRSILLQSAFEAFLLTAGRAESAPSSVATTLLHDTLSPPSTEPYLAEQMRQLSECPSRNPSITTSALLRSSGLQVPSTGPLSVGIAEKRNHTSGGSTRASVLAAVEAVNLARFLEAQTPRK